jgi:ribonucleoside-diphosphate reductase alpha chain
LKHRPIGIGVQGLADVFLMMNVAFYSEKASELNRLIFETMYYAALETSMQLARERYEEMARTHVDGFLNNLPEIAGAYDSFEGSPSSKGILQFDMWNVTPTPGRYDWDGLKKDICRYGTRNSLLIALMPTASTSQILGNNECFEPITSNIYTRRTLAGEFIMVNRYLMADLVALGAWNEQVKQSIVKNKGSVQHLHIPGFDDHLKNKYRTVWEIPMKHLIDMSVDRAPFVCQSQSLNLWVEDPNYNLLTSMHFYAWKKGLKTGIYYLRRKAKHQAQQFTVAADTNTTTSSNVNANVECELCSA